MRRTLWDNTNFSPHTASATGEWQALRHSWMRCTLLYSTNPKNDTAELLKVDIITANLQLMVSTTTRSEKLWPSILDSSPISVWTKAPSAGISHATFGFLLHYQNIHELLELFTQSKLRDTDSAGDAEEYEREFETVIFAGALLLAVSHVVLIAYGQSMVWVTAS